MNLFVGNLSPETSEDQLRQLFSEFGPIKSTKIPLDSATGLPRGFGFVEMEDKFHGYDAIDNLDCTYFMGAIISVKESKPKNQGGGGAHRGGGGGFNRNRNFNRQEGGSGGGFNRNRSYNNNRNDRSSNDRSSYNSRGGNYNSGNSYNNGNSYNSGSSYNSGGYNNNNDKDYNKL
ncbi:RNA recognition motif domain-containing protein [Polluticoccus soli]|uniref:RNA recognition motif domain-containing protein n=1 Tax=Polluticoccus soli TaxID=3034150 RepID=UPI0023E1A632|nr:RNA-binding protein [Flavipsychrobacter sp. JY13-12]